MSDKSPVVTLPNRDKMMRRLMRVNSDPYLHRNLYPLLLKDAGKEYSGPAIVTILLYALSDFAQGGRLMAIPRILRMNPDDYIKALVEDPQVRREALASLRSAGI